MPLSELPSAKFLQKDKPFWVNDLMNDDRLDKELLGLLEQRMPGIRSSIALPLVVGDDWFGLLTAFHSAPLQTGEEELRQIMSLTDQAATVIQTMLLLQETQERAEEEQALRQITTRVSTAVDAESILRTAAEEIGRALGLEGSIVLQGAGITQVTNGDNEQIETPEE